MIDNEEAAANIEADVDEQMKGVRADGDNHDEHNNY